MQKKMQKTLIILFWLAVWQLVSLWVDNAILLVGPLQVLRVFIQNIFRPDFWLTVLSSFSRIGGGFLLAFFSGVLLGAVGYRHPFVQEVLSPVVEMLKSIPVASFVVLLLIWFGSSKLSFFISLLIVFPNVYVNTIAGLKSTDEKLLEMARVFGVSGWNRYFYLYRPALLPYLSSCLKISLGMSWKSGVAAEVIGLPDNSLGERLYMSKIYLDTAGLFAWTLTVILLSYFFEKGVLRLLECYGEWKPYPKPGAAKSQFFSRSGDGSEALPEQVGLGQTGDILVEHLNKSYGALQVLQDFNLKAESGGRYLLMAPSGSGKTTLLRILAGLERADGGRISWQSTDSADEKAKRQEHIEAIDIGMVFQEDCLCEEYDALSNIMLTMRTETRKSGQGKPYGSCGEGGSALRQREERSEWVRKEAACILPEDCLTKPVKELSGGMRRRVAVLRAIHSDARVLIMDEPFTGLDEENRKRTAAYLLERLEGRTLLVTTHREDDAELLQGVKVELKHERR